MHRTAVHRWALIEQHQVSGQVWPVDVQHCLQSTDKLYSSRSWSSFHEEAQTGTVQADGVCQVSWLVSNLVSCETHPCTLHAPLQPLHTFHNRRLAELLSGCVQRGKPALSSALPGRPRTYQRLVKAIASIQISTAGSWWLWTTAEALLFFRFSQQTHCWKELVSN